MIIFKVIAIASVLITGNSLEVEDVEPPSIEPIKLGGIETLDLTPELVEPPKEPIEVEPELVEVVEVAEIVKAETLSVCDTNAAFASYMGYQHITRGTQMEYQQGAYTNSRGYREYNGYVMIAMANRYGNVGDLVTITFENGHIETFILGDIKGNTDCTHGNSIIEVIVDEGIIADRSLGKIQEYSYRLEEITR